MQSSLSTPVSVLRLPRGPHGRRALLKPDTQESREVQESRESQELRTEPASRSSSSLLAVGGGHQVSFTLHESVHVTVHFGATDLGVTNFYVSQLQTPIGVQAQALLQRNDIIAYTFKP
ncbi:PREDICTED: gem-associated protein 7-like [Chrysochloris asiatica]|uniref:Gem-associated protein 7-like n=1 Tax=Chrysochloris asiatica TaxID=185453 RepID=A0A9B0TPS9_CHRAS|nr:PREDICTED: gem-associated protein 7-like [Chrysochloris asiatica]